MPVTDVEVRQAAADPQAVASQWPIGGTRG
jgi:hypothetical protein